MTDDDKPLAGVFHLDQAEAQSEQATRDQAQWDMAVAATQADTATKTGYAAHLEAKAQFWRALAFLIYVAALAGALAFIQWWGAQ